MFDFGILGINARNLQYIRKFNPEKAVRLADNKIRTKEFLSARGIPVPTTYGVIDTRQELAEFDFNTIPHEEFIIKPARGSRGRGVFRVRKLQEQVLQMEESSHLSPYRSALQKLFGPVISAASYDVHHREVDEKLLSEHILKSYCVDILDGKQSLQNKPDQILIEELLTAGEWFTQYCTYGLADIRVIVYNFVPVAAMLRVPTQQSEGKANLDRGGVGFGVEVGSGKVVSMYLKGKTYRKSFPEPYTGFLGSKLPYREDILQRSTQIQYYVNLWYLALDRVITEEGPKLLEINARAGLKIQLALQLPLKQRLEKVGDLKITSPEKGVEISQTLFSHHTTGLISPTKILPHSWFGKLRGKPHGHTFSHDIFVEVDLTKKGCFIDSSSVKLFWKVLQSLELLYGSEYTRIALPSREVDTHLPQSHLVIGADIVKGFFIKPSTERREHLSFFRTDLIAQHEYDMLRVLDNRLAKLGTKLVFSHYLKPTNFLEEFDRFLQLQGKYNPIFIYRWPTQKKLDLIATELERIQEEFRKTHSLESGLMPLFHEKLQELQTKYALLVAYIHQDFDALFQLQQEYRGDFSSELVIEAQERFEQRVGEGRGVLGSVLSRKKMKGAIAKYLQEHGRTQLPVLFTPDSFARMSVQKRPGHSVLRIAAGARFRKADLYAALAHELVHLRRYANAGLSAWQLLKRGTAKYIIDEEWLAIHAAEQELPDSYEKIAMRKKYALVGYAQDHNFVQIADYLRSNDQKSLLGVFKTAYRLKRGIQHTTQIAQGAVSLQDTIYLQWYRRIQQWLEQGGDKEQLMRAKIKIEDVKYLS